MDDVRIFDDADEDEDAKQHERELELWTKPRTLRRGIEEACRLTQSHKAPPNELDNLCGDGDCGTTLAFGVRSVLGNVGMFEMRSLTRTLRIMAQLLSIGGSSGALYGY